MIYPKRSPAVSDWMRGVGVSWVVPIHIGIMKERGTTTTYLYCLKYNFDDRLWFFFFILTTVIYIYASSTSAAHAGHFVAAGFSIHIFFLGTLHRVRVVSIPVPAYTYLYIYINRIVYVQRQRCVYFLIKSNERVKKSIFGGNVFE